ncbi:MAG: DNA/RNA helicase domain-containing protein, partial [Armatimonadota bacterium]
ERFDGEPEARFGLLASSRDKSLPAFGIHNDFQATKNVKLGRWFADDEDDEGGWSCRQLNRCITEFQCQGLETDGALVAWGTDFVWEAVDAAGTMGWTNSRARQYMAKSGTVKNPLQLRRNAYRVLLTRARNATVVYVPELPILDDTFRYLVASGFIETS